MGREGARKRARGRERAREGARGRDGVLHKRAQEGGRSACFGFSVVISSAQNRRKAVTLRHLGRGGAGARGREGARGGARGVLCNLNRGLLVPASRW